MATMAACQCMPRRPAAAGTTALATCMVHTMAATAGTQRTRSLMIRKGRARDAHDGRTRPWSSRLLRVPPCGFASATCVRGLRHGHVALVEGG